MLFRISMIAVPMASSSGVDALEYLPRSQTVAYAQGDVVFGCGQRSTHLYLVVRGSVRAGWFKPNNRWLNLETYGPEDVFGESVLIQQTRPCWAIARTTTELMVWKAAEIDALAMERPGLAVALSQIVAARLIKYGEQIRLLRLRPALD